MLPLGQLPIAVDGVVAAPLQLVADRRFTGAGNAVDEVVLNTHFRFGRYASVSSQQLERARSICLALPETSERMSHGEPTFFVGGRVFVMFANNHHGDGRVAVWLPAPPGAQEALIEARPATYFRPPYVGGRGWVGVVLDAVDDAELRLYIETAWELIAPKRLRAARGTGHNQPAGEGA